SEAGALRVQVRRVAGPPRHHLPGWHQLPDLSGPGADRGELRPALGPRWPADAGDPVARRRDDGGVQRAELVLTAPGSRQAAAGLRAVRLRDGLPGRADDGDDRARTV